MKTRALLSCLFVLVLAACVTPRAEVVSSTESYPPTARVDLLLDKPTRPFKTFALLQDTFGGTPEQINARLEAKGREIGADAVWIIRVNDKSVTDWILMDPCFGPHYRYCGPMYQPVHYSYRVVVARAIKYLPK
jgi:hypothetical protein